MTPVPRRIAVIDTATSSSPLSSRASTSMTAASAGSREVLPPTNDGWLAETQELFSTTIGMSESDLLALEAKVRAVGGATESPFASRSPCGQASTFMSQANTPVSHPGSSMLHSHTPLAPVQIASHSCVSGSKHFHETESSFQRGTE